MSIWAAGALAAAICVSPARGDEPALEPPLVCRNGVPGGLSCITTKKDLKDAQSAFKRGIKLHEHQRFEEALAQFEEATRLVPQNQEYLTAREVLRSKLAFDHIQRGNSLLLEDARTHAAAEFRLALDLDPENQFAQERLEEATQQLSPVTTRTAPQPQAESEEVHLQPTNDLATFHFSGDVKTLFTELAAAYKIGVQFDDSNRSALERQVRFNIDSVDFFTALSLADKVGKMMWTPLGSHQMLVLADSQENHRQYDRMSLRTFILPPHSTPQEATDLVNALRQMLGQAGTVQELKTLSPGQTSNTLEVRGARGAVDACAKILAQLSNPKPQVVIDVRVFQISHTLTRNIGVHIPNTFNMYNIPAAALAGLGGQNLQDLINQLIASGGINQAGSTSLAGLLSQLTGQQNSIFSQPLATFGGGLTFMGLSLDHFAAQLSLNESWVRTLDDVSLRAGQGTDATLHLGQRYPILNASYAPIYNSPQISQVLGNQSYIPPIPSVSYEDLGLNLKATPTIHGNGSVSLKLELQVRSLTGQANNGVPVISNREYKASINLRDGEPTFVAGEISNNDVRSMSGLPELMIVITPHVVSNYDRSPHEIWISER